jgi:predicted transcriptional regulator
MTHEPAGVFRPRLSHDGNFTIIPNAWIRNSGLSAQANYLLIYLVSHEVGYEIKFDQISRETGLGVKGIRSAISELKNAGWLTTERTQKSNGQLGAYRYIILEPTTVPQGTLAQSTVAEATVAEGTDNKKINNKENKLEENKTKELFSEFWKEYPRKLDKGAAFKAFRSALKEATFEQILAGAIAYRNDPNRDPEFTKYPATWLNAGAWENEIQPSPDSEAAQRAQQRREREIQRSNEYLAEIREQEKQASAPKLCEHGKNLALCVPCSKSLG